MILLSFAYLPYEDCWSAVQTELEKEERLKPICFGPLESTLGELFDRGYRLEAYGEGLRRHSTAARAQVYLTKFGVKRKWRVGRIPLNVLFMSKRSNTHLLGVTSLHINESMVPWIEDRQFDTHWTEHQPRKVEPPKQQTRLELLTKLAEEYALPPEPIMVGNRTLEEWKQDQLRD
jgi:hypothetical protein